MSQVHKALSELASKAVQNLFGDTSVEPGDTKASLLVLRDEIDSMIDCLGEDSGDIEVDEHIDTLDE